MILITILYALFGGSFTMGKVLLNYTTPFFLTGSRFFISGIILLAYQYFYAHKQFRFKKKHLWLYAQIIFFGIYITYLLRFWALQEMPSAKTCFLYNLSPFISSLYSYIFFNERMSGKQWLGLGIGCIGLLPILLTTSPAEQLVGEVSFLSFAEIAVILSVATHSYGWIVMRKLVRDKSYAPAMVNGLSMTVAGILALISSFLVEGFQLVSDPVPFAGGLAFVIITSNIICYNLYGHLLRTYTATFLSFAGFLGPLFAALYGWFFLGETITWHFYLSSIIVFIGLYLFYQDELQNHKEREEPNI